MNLAVVMTAWRRPGYTREAIVSVLEAFPGCAFKVFIEPGCPAVAEEVARLGVDHVVNHKRLNCAGNGRQAWEWGFEQSDFVVRTEDDIVWSPQTLGYLSWARDTFRGSNITHVGLYSQHDGEPYETFLYNRLTLSGGWGLWRDRWEDLIRPAWPSEDKPEAPGTVLNRTLTLPGIYPSLSLALNIGEKGGHYGTPEMWQRYRLDRWAGNVEWPPGGWKAPVG